MSLKDSEELTAAVEKLMTLDSWKLGQALADLQATVADLEKRLAAVETDIMVKTVDSTTGLTANQLTAFAQEERKRFLSKDKKPAEEDIPELPWKPT